MTTTPYFLQIDSIPGGGTEDGHEGWIPIRSFDIGRGDDDMRFSFFAFPDQSMPLLTMCSANGRLLASAKLEQVFKSNAPPKIFTLRRVIVSDLLPLKEGFRFTLNPESVEMYPANISGVSPDYPGKPDRP